MNHGNASPTSHYTVAKTVLTSTENPMCGELTTQQSEALEYDFGDPRLRRVKDCLEANLSQGLSLGKAAGIAGLTTAYFSYYFHRKTGVRFTSWVHSVRLRTAVRLIEKSDDTITAIAERVGYCGLRTFERAFRRLHSTTARQHRTNLRKRR